MGAAVGCGGGCCVAIMVIAVVIISSFPPSAGMALPPAFPTLVENHVGHGYMGAMEPKQVYQAPPQVTPSRYSPVPRHMLGEEDFTRSVLGGCAAAAAAVVVVVVVLLLLWSLLFLNDCLYHLFMICHGSND